MNLRSKELLEDMLSRIPELCGCRGDITAAFDVLQSCYENGGKVLVCGNGGSAADSEHIVGELMKGFLLKRRISPEQVRKLKEAFPDEGGYLAQNLQGALPAIALTGQIALSTAFSNDVAPDMVFAQQVFGYARQGDVLVGISTSGNSKNVVHAIQVARAFGMKNVGLTGQRGGRMGELCDVTIRVPHTETFRVQEYHLPVYHTLCAMLEAEFFHE